MIHVQRVRRNYVGVAFGFMHLRAVGSFVVEHWMERSWISRLRMFVRRREIEMRQNVQNTRGV